MGAEAVSRPMEIRLVSLCAPAAIVGAAGLAVRTPIAAAWPMAALLLFLWIAADTMMLALVAATPDRRPAPHRIVGVLAAASVTVWLGSRRRRCAMPC